jgi:hypothetical protein
MQKVSQHDASFTTYVQRNARRPTNIQPLRLWMVVGIGTTVLGRQLPGLVLGLSTDNETKRDIPRRHVTTVNTA